MVVNGTQIEGETDAQGRFVVAAVGDEILIAHAGGHLTATDAACFATSTGWRIASFTTNVLNRSREVTAASAGMSTNGSMNGLSCRNSRFPSAVYGYFESESRGYAIESGTTIESQPESSAAMARGA